ncbi:HAD family hydrolase [Salsipaludibacter albus]|uniref:HAD family hydrolase n=1 Tax=Salsipaludibacter albus TaxID=2849650 RepID=UPI001EE481D1|nr:HAD-IB family hydrolase [Salsipaludibacter albus]
MTATRAAAFFDLDRTLISGASPATFAIAAWRNGLLDGRVLARDGVGALMFRLFGASDETSVASRDRILEIVGGTRRDELMALNEEVIPALLDKIRPESHGLIEMHHEAGRDTYIVSASPQELVGALASALGMTGGIGTRAEVVDGLYTGRLDGPFVYGEGKTEAIGMLADDRDYDLRLCYGYSDSASDLPMLELVGHPVAVNPDSALESVAQQRGWPIVIFSRKTKRVIRTTTAISGALGLASATYAAGRRHGRTLEAAELARSSPAWKPWS